MNTYSPQHAYKQQEVKTTSSEGLIYKLYKAGIKACRREDRKKLRLVLTELMGSLNEGPDPQLATTLIGIYESCIYQSINGDLDDIEEVLIGLQEAWEENVLKVSAPSRPDASSSPSRAKRAYVG